MSARFSLSVVGLFALAACNAADPHPNEAVEAPIENAAGMPAPNAREGSNNQQAVSAEPVETDESVNASASAPRDPEAVTRAWFAGRWTDTGDCADAATFAANGTYSLADGTRGMWNVQDSRLVVQNDGGRNVVRLRRIGEGEVETIAEDGAAGRSKRC